MELKLGLKREESYIVKESDIASFLGSGDVAVLSTPAMILMMESTSLKLAQEYLPEGYTTVGTKVCVSHLKPAPLGARVRVISELTEVDGRRLVFKVEAYWNDVKIGEGTHERFVVNREKFLAKVKEMVSR